jgi:hypothetical protein
MNTCPACGDRVTDLDLHIETTEDCLRAVEMGLVDLEDNS